MRYWIDRFAIVGALLLVVGCGGTDGGGGVASDGMDDEQIITDYVDNTVLPTYETLDTRASELNSAVDTFAEDPNAETLEAARQAWVETRTPWEQSEAFLFGPVDSNGYDPALDSWPVDRNQLDNVLESDEELTREYVAGLDPSQKGFHTIEYLLFGEGGQKTAGDFTDREFAYLQATTEELAGIAGDLHASWAEGVEGAEPYADVFRTAGGENNQQYPSRQSAGQEMVDGMLTIVDEVGNGKIADPFNERDTTLVESQFSYNSLTDFRNNLVGVKNVYLNQSVAGSSGESLSSWVASEDEELDQRVRTQIDEAISAIDAIPEPFRDAISDEQGRQKIQQATDALSKLQTTLNGEVLPLVSGN
jgi:predicted lipoprotein